MEIRPTTHAKINPSKIISEDRNIDTGQITVEEFIIIFKRLKMNKAPGRDRTTAELYKYLSSDNIEIIARLFNSFWNLKAVQESSRKQTWLVFLRRETLIILPTPDQYHF